MFCEKSEIFLMFCHIDPSFFNPNISSTKKTFYFIFRKLKLLSRRRKKETQRLKLVNLMKRTVYTGSVQEFRANSKSNVQNGNPSKTEPVVSIDQNQKQFYEILLVSKKTKTL